MTGVQTCALPIFQNGRNAYSYIDGECVVDLPLGRVFLEPVNSLCAWAQAHKGDLEAAHAKRRKGRTKK